MFRHYDADHPHLHILVNRIGYDGQVVSDSNAGDKCEICNWAGEKDPDCHEVWTYDNELITQRLTQFQAICPACYWRIYPMTYCGKEGGEMVVEEIE